jgi:hypothetical protein
MWRWTAIYDRATQCLAVVTPEVRLRCAWAKASAKANIHGLTSRSARLSCCAAGVDISFQKRGGTFAHFVRDPTHHKAFLTDFFASTGKDYKRFNYLGEWHSHPSSRRSCGDRPRRAHRRKARIDHLGQAGHGARRQTSGGLEHPDHRPVWRHTGAAAHSRPQLHDGTVRPHRGDTDRDGPAATCRSADAARTLRTAHRASRRGRGSISRSDFLPAVPRPRSRRPLSAHCRTEHRDPSPSYGSL